MGERIQPGGRVDEETYRAFRQYVKDRHGAVRGNIGRELEKAMQNYMSTTQGPDQLDRIENDIATLKAQMADAESDGGTVPRPPSEPSHTHTPNNKPSHNAPRAEKAAWLVEENYDREGGSLSVSHIIDDLNHCFGFEERTAKKYIQLVINELDAKRHPNNDRLVVWGSEIERLKQRLSEDEDE